MNIKLINTLLFIACTCYGYSQQLSDKIGTNPTIINPSAVVEIESTTKGFLPPRMSSWQRDAISSPDVGLLVYCTNCGSNGELEIFNGTTWTNILGGASANPNLTNSMTTQSGGILQFMTHNLGADTSADPLTPSWKLNGAYFQFGKKPIDTNGDGYKTKLNDGANGFAAAPNGPLSADANYGVVSSWSQTQAISTSWNVSPTIPLKTGTDPCPTGYRIPTYAEWESIRTYIEAGTRVGSWVAGSTNYDSGVLINGNVYLPAAGIRNTTDGGGLQRGETAFYWSATMRDATYNYAIRIVKVGQNLPSNVTRLFALSVRCVKE